MPIYEYRCQDCGRVSSLLILRRDQAGAVCCSHCGSLRLDRLLSRFASPRSGRSSLESMNDLGGLDGLDDPDSERMTGTMMGTERDRRHAFDDDLEEPSDSDSGFTDDLAGDFDDVSD